MMPLLHLPQGALGVIEDVIAHAARRDRLAAFGLVQGTRVAILQRKPALIVAFDGTELALDPRIGMEIRVRAQG